MNPVTRNGGIVGKTLDLGDTNVYTVTGNKKNSGIWDLPAVYDFKTGPSGLYDFTTFTFTSGGVYGYLGPTKTQLLNSYDTATYDWLNDTNYYDSADGFQNWTVPSSGDYTFVIVGGTGGDSTSRTLGTGIYGGKGAKLTFTITLTEGDILKLLVGQRGVNNLSNSRGAGGGGGTYVYNNTTTTLIAAAGGGGGAGDYGGAANQANVNANHSGTSGYNGYYRTTYGGTGVGVGGTNGSGGGAASYGSGGAGWLSDGTDSTYTLAGHRFLTTTQPGWGGSHYNKVYTNNTDTNSSNGSNGGFGGGGGSYAGAGGGGGYSGGGGGNWAYAGAGGGGGSYIDNTATNISTSLGDNYTSNGYITVTKV